MQKRKPQPEAPERVSPEDFIRAWQSSSTTAEVARRLDMRRGTVIERARFYRERGVKLQPLGRVDWRSMADLASSVGRSK
jgi:hypothetical protein